MGSDFSATPFKAKISVHTMLVIGGRDIDAGAVLVRLHSKGNIGAKAKAETVVEIPRTIHECLP